MAKNKKTITHLVCEHCKMRNYTQKLSKGRTIGSLQLKKFCSKCRSCRLHKESK